MMTTFRRRAQDEAGATMVEFALVSIVAFMLMLGLFQMGLIVLGNSAGSNAARDGARLGIIDYIGADNTSTTNYSAILAAVQDNLSDTVRNLSVSARCLNGITLAQVTCSATSVDLTRGDLIEVVATWDHKGFGPFVTTLSRSSTARMVISGRPDLTSVTAPTTTTTASTTTTTTPGPAKYTVSSLHMEDDDTDGVVDRVVATFSGSGSLADCTDTSMWMLANVPSGGGLQSVSVSSNVATLTLNGSTKDTAVGSFTVAFSPSGGCTGANSFAASAPQDRAKPVPVSISDVNGATDGKPEAGDRLTVTFSEPVVPGWSSNSTTATFHRQGNQNTTLEIPSFADGKRDTGTDAGYVNKNQTARFDATLTLSGSSVTVTLDSCNGGCDQTIAGSGDFSFAAVSTFEDALGNAVTGSLLATSFSLF